jgi:alpha-methylacyl-CoA racemase
MLLSDLGDEILRIDRPGGNGWPNPVTDPGRHTLELGIRSEEGRAIALESIAADVLVEGYRPGVMERLGFGPDAMLESNPRLIYGRMTGWGQTGPLARAAGHDINYIALTGALAAIVDSDGRPQPPLNLVGDFGGGSLYLALGIVSALFERQQSGKGQVIDAAIVDGVASLMTMFSGMTLSGGLSLEPSANPLAGRAPFYRCYRCGDRKLCRSARSSRISIRNFSGELPPRHRCWRTRTRHHWARAAASLEAIFMQRTRDEWCALLEGTDACFAPVLTLEESFDHPHLIAREIYVEQKSVRHAAPAPRLSRTPGRIADGGDGAVLLDRWRASRKGA